MSQTELSFELDGETVYIELDEKDPAYVRLVICDWWRIESGSQLNAACWCAGIINFQNKGVKISLSHEPSVWLSVEFLMDGHEQSGCDQLRRRIIMLKKGMGDFSELLKDSIMMDEVANDLSCGSAVH